MLTRLIYASETTEALSPAAVQHIVDRARANNTRLHLSGLLLFDSRSFLQVLEGQRAAVSALFGRIATDPRHRRIELLEVTPVHERRFARWSMGFAPADAAHAELFLRFGGTPAFNPYAMCAAGALGLLECVGASQATALSLPQAARVDVPGAAPRSAVQ